MDYQSLNRQDYDSRIRFCGKELPCYSPKEFHEKYGNANPKILGELTGREKSNRRTTVEINSVRYGILKAGAKSRLLYREAGYLLLDNGSFIVILQRRIPVWVFYLLAAAVIAVVVWWFFLKPEPVEHIDPNSIDENAGVLEGDTTEKKESEDGGGAMTLTYSLDATLTLSTGDVEIYFLNPNASNHDLSLALYIVTEDSAVKIAESGRVPSGYGLEHMQFIENSAELSAGVYDAEYIASFYHPETGEKALVESTITDVKLTVQP